MKKSLQADFELNMIDKVKYFPFIAIETTSFCNRSCAYCPQSIDKREKLERLSKKHIDKIIAELKNLEYKGVIYLHLFNEPLLDQNIISTLKEMRSACPGAKISFSSNGDYLTPLKMEQFINAGLDYIFVTQYDGKTSPALQGVIDALKQRGQEMFLKVRVENVFSNNRGGALKQIRADFPLNAPCVRPDKMIVVNYKGEVVLCCNDYYGKEVLGSIDSERLIDIWNSNRLEKYRTELRSGNRMVCELCYYCSDITQVA